MLKYWLVALNLMTVSACGSNSECYSPTQNLDHAHEPSWSGCPCTDADADQCIDDVALVCEAGFWQAVEDGPCMPEPSLGSCYSPTQNLEHAYESGWSGCPCTEADADQCIDGVALVCEDGFWQAVVDGPCMPEF